MCVPALSLYFHFLIARHAIPLQSDISTNALENKSGTKSKVCKSDVLLTVQFRIYFQSHRKLTFQWHLKRL
jgi:hypothetical protein